MLIKPCSDILKRNTNAVSEGQVDAQVQDINEVIVYEKKNRCSSSTGKESLKKRECTYKKMLPFIVNPRCKPVKKQMGFRRRTGSLSQSCTVDKRVSMASSCSRRKKKRKKKCNVVAQAGSQQPSVSSITHGLDP